MRLLAATVAAISFSAISISAPASDDTDMQTCAGPQSEMAVAACQRVLKSKPLTKEREEKARYSLGAIEVNLGHPDEAIANLTRVINLDPKMVGGYTARAAAYANKKEYDRAFADLSAAIKIRPDDARSYYVRCKIYSQMRQYGLALPDCDKAVLLKPGNSETHLHRGFVYFMLRQDEPALSDFNRAIQINPKSYGALLFRGKIFRERKDMDRAIADHETAAALAPDNDDVLRNLSLDYLFAWRPDRAVTEFDTLVRLKPDAPAPYYYRAEALEWAHHPAEEAIADLNTFIRLAPADPKGYESRGEDFEKNGQFSKAAADFSEAIRLDPGKALFYAERCQNRAAANEDLNAALADCTQALHIDSGYWEALSGRGFVELRLKRYRLALTDFSARIEKENSVPKNLGERIETDLANLILAQFGNTIPHYPKGSILGSDLAEAYCGRAMAKTKLGDIKGGGVDLATAKDIDADAAAYCQRVFW